ncbi:MAG: hypothetical protein AAFP00_05150 [Bacteroidota bacterium]
MIKGNRWVIRNCIILYGLVLYAAPMMYGQTSSPEGRLPPILMVRGEESYTFLKNNDSTSFFLHKLKWIPLNEKESVALTLGGEYRARLEHFTNEDYTPTNRTYYAQRLSLHAGLTLTLGMVRYWLLIFYLFFLLTLKKKRRLPHSYFFCIY